MRLTSLLPSGAPAALTLPNASVADAESIIPASPQSPSFKAFANKPVRPTVSKLRFLGLSLVADRRAAGGVGGARSRRVTHTVSRPVAFLCPRLVGYVNAVVEGGGGLCGKGERWREITRGSVFVGVVDGEG